MPYYLFKTILAYYCIICSTAPVLTKAQLTELRPFFIEQAIGLELTEDEGFQGYSDDAVLECLRSRYLEYKDYPSLADLALFPGDQTIRTLINQNIKYREQLAYLWSVSPGWQEGLYAAAFTDALRVSDLLYELGAAAYDRNSICYRRYSLDRYRQLVGEANYYGGYVPSPRYILP